jgi:pyrroloquinoline quinone biosynthesis protein B
VSTLEVRILGSAAGGGSPQWNCNCTVCTAVRRGDAGTQPRMQSSLAIRSGDGPWLLVNASPDVHRQVDLMPADHRATGGRSTPFAGVLLTDAEIDHASGLLLLRESTEPLQLFATAQAHGALTDEWPLITMLSDWCGVDWHELTAGQATELGGFDLTADCFTTGEDAPRYQRSPGGPGTSIGITFRNAGGQSVTYCPTIETWTDELAARLDASDLVLVDSTFWGATELADEGLGTRSARDMGHVPLGGPDGTAHRLAALDTRVVAVHINNTNRILLEGSPERVELDGLGITVAHDGLHLEIS